MTKIEILQERIAEEVADLARQGERHIDVFVELVNGTTAQVYGEADYDGYVEDDFHCGFGNGTGAFIPTSARCNLSIEAYDANDDEITVDTAAIEEYVEQNLMSV